MLVIGRHSSSTVEPDIDLGRPPEDTGVSRRHARLDRQPEGRYAIIDFGSTNGTYINALTSPIPTTLPTMLEAGDRIYLGNFTCLELRRTDNDTRPAG
jgi:pSer/pThr/pTyr-binding forkhead associated (FHA) protein